MRVPLADQVGDPPGEHPGLARAGAGDDQHRRALVQHRLALRRVQALQQLVAVRAAGVVARPRVPAPAVVVADGGAEVGAVLMTPPPTTCRPTTDVRRRAGSRRPAYADAHVVAGGSRWARVVRHAALAVAAVQGATLLALVAVDLYRKRGRRPVDFPRVPPRSITAGGSEVTVYTYGEDLYRDMLDAIAQARSRVFFETFIWKGDAIGQAFKDALIAAADRGVKVYVVYDHFANLVVPPQLLHVPPQRRRPPAPARSRSPFRPLRNSGRDHRKILVVDDAVALRRRLQHRQPLRHRLARHPRPAHRRRRLGPAERLHRLLEPLRLAAAAPALPDLGGHTWHPDIRVHRNIPRNLVYPIRAMYLEAIDRASHHIYLTHAYLIPDADMLARARPRRPARGGRADHHPGRSPTTSSPTGCPAGSTARCCAAGSGCSSTRTRWCTRRPRPSTASGRPSAPPTSTGSACTATTRSTSRSTTRPSRGSWRTIFEVDSSNTVELTWDDWQRRHALVKFSETVLTPFRPLL